MASQLVTSRLVLSSTVSLLVMIIGATVAPAALLFRLLRHDVIYYVKNQGI
jgi:hypothetical protein